VDIALVTEGTYPHSFGGVSVWCDQLIRGMSEHSFQIIAVTGTGRETLAVELPSNVESLQTVALWGPPVRTSGTSHSRLDVIRRVASPGHRIQASLVREATWRLGHALLNPDVTAARPGFASALRSWAALAVDHDVESLLVSREFVGLLLERWSADAITTNWGGRARGLPTVADAVLASRLIAHSLRPLQMEPPKADLVHLVANGIAGLVGLSAKWRYGTPFVLSEHGIYLRERYLAFRDSPYSWPVKWIMLRFYRLLISTVYSEASLVAPGNIYNRRWEQWDGVPEASIRTVYNGVDPGEFGEAETEPEIPTLTWVGRIDPLKDLETLVRSFAIVRQSEPRALLRIFGGTPRGNEAYRDAIIMLVGELGLKDAVSFEGRVERIQEAYAAGNVVVLSSISEGFPYTVIEAMSSARATVSTDVGGVAEAVGDVGVVVPPADPQSMAWACLDLLNDPVRRQTLATAARQRVIELFTLERFLEAFRMIYSDVQAHTLELQASA
jgi:glycosyltransferase involved in cell wall biosynthesis